MAAKPEKKPDPEQSQREGPAAYAPHQDDPTSGDEAQKHREKLPRQQAEGDR